MIRYYTSNIVLCLLIIKVILSISSQIVCDLILNIKSIYLYHKLILHVLVCKTVYRKMLLFSNIESVKVIE